MGDCRLIVVLMLGSMLIPLVVSNIGGRNQRVAVKGKLVCPSDPAKAKNVQVKLVDEDPGLDDKMAETKTDANGEFHMNGTENEVSDIEPRVKIYHDCDDGWKPCQRKWKLRVPGMYITADKDPQKQMDLGTLNLEVRLKTEERDCVH